MLTEFTRLAELMNDGRYAETEDSARSLLDRQR
jgi:hypothetical protein